MKQTILSNLIYLILLCLPTYLIRFKIFSIPFTFLETLILLLFLLFLIFNKGRFSLGKYKYIIYSFVILGFIASIYSVDQIRALGILKAYIIEPVLFFIVLINVKFKFSKVLQALGWSAIFVSLVAIFQYITGWGIPAPWNVRGPEFRVTSVYGYPNAVGLYLTSILILFLGNLIKIRKNIYFSIVVILFCSLALVGAMTQGAWLAVLMAFIFLGFFTKYRKLFITGLALGLIFIILIPSFRQVATFQDTSGQVRLALWQGTASLIKDRPLLGAGLASFPEIYQEYKLDRHVELLLYPHNIFLNFYVQLGLLGLIWLLYVLWWFFKNGFKNVNAANITVMAAMVGILIYGLVDVPYFKNDLAIIFWTLLAMLYKS